MYLKRLELIGFKSFADKTCLEFEPGMTAIVGPNGCGKSNISDAVRWVLGEQSAKALRGNKMEDCIFTGTDDRKPLGMAEVGITFAECEKNLNTEYNEVTVTRRVFRSGEGQYFINKTPCRLKDIQRLFMDTGIGTTSYSLMEQGRIDQVLSSRPEDRRTIFEEASGITKFKTDKKEAIRKLEHTESNLIRLADVIREVKRQIGSLQRQAGKALRYKALREELRKLDIYTTKQRLISMDIDIQKLESEISDANKKICALKIEIEELEQGNAVLRQSILQTEQERGTISKKVVEAQSKLDHTRELIRVNRQRIEEYRGWSEREAQQADKADKQIEEQRRNIEELSHRLETALIEKNEADKELKLRNDILASHQQEVETMRREVHDLHSESVQLESLSSKLQNQLIQIESREHSDTIQRERLFAERAQLEHAAKRYEKRQAEMLQVLQDLENNVTRCNDLTGKLEQQKIQKNQEIEKIRQSLAELHCQTSAQKAQISLLRNNNAGEESNAETARLLLDKSNPLEIDKNKILGSIVSHLDVDPDHRTALDAVLHSWLDAILVEDIASAVEILQKLESRNQGPARLLAINTTDEPQPSATAGEAGARLVDHVKCSDITTPLIRRLLGNVIVLDSLATLPSPIPVHGVYVTREGSLVRGDGCVEYWMADASLDNPYLLANLEESLTGLEKQIMDHDNRLKTFLSENAELQKHIDEARSELDEQRHTFAVKEGENHVVARETDQARDRSNTVTWELDNLTTQSDSEVTERTSTSEELNRIREQREKTSQEIEIKTEKLHELETRHSDLQSKATEQSMRFAQLHQELEHLENRHGTAMTHLEELETLARASSEGLVSYETNIEQLTESIKNAEDQLVSLQKEVEINESRSENLRKNREKQSQELEELEKTLAKNRTLMDELRNRKSDLDLKYNEVTLRRQNHLDRIASEYNITMEQIMEEPEIEWENGKPGMDTLETSIAELRTKLDAMGPVNLVAIEEYHELEERYNFLTHQEEDLVKANQQLLEMIRKINCTTSEMFRSTFAAVNENFLTMFKKLFNGGSAKLVLVNEEDVLECGIEIIARPPGKRLQNISLLSGGERTLTAVALLFAIYMIKPSPFCLLDELDAALDDSNIGRFVNILKEFLNQSQFVVITHNRQTIAAANVLYGITMHEKGVSKIVSMKFKEYEEKTAQLTVA